MRGCRWAVGEIARDWQTADDYLYTFPELPTDAFNLWKTQQQLRRSLPQQQQQRHLPPTAALFTHFAYFTQQQCPLLSPSQPTKPCVWDLIYQKLIMRGWRWTIGGLAWNSWPAEDYLYTLQEIYTDAQYGPDFGLYSTGNILNGEFFNSYTTYKKRNAHFQKKNTFRPPHA